MGDTLAMKVWNTLNNFIYNTSELSTQPAHLLWTEASVWVFRIPERNGRHVIFVLHKSLTEVLGLFCYHPSGLFQACSEGGEVHVCGCVCAGPRQSVFVYPQCNIHDEFCCNLSVFREAAKQKQRQWEIGKSTLTWHLHMPFNGPGALPSPVRVSQTLWGQQIINI